MKHSLGWKDFSIEFKITGSFGLSKMKYSVGDARGESLIMSVGAGVESRRKPTKNLVYARADYGLFRSRRRSVLAPRME